MHIEDLRRWANNRTKDLLHVQPQVPAMVHIEFGQSIVRNVDVIEAAQRVEETPWHEGIRDRGLHFIPIGHQEGKLIAVVGTASVLIAAYVTYKKLESRVLNELTRLNEVSHSIDEKHIISSDLQGRVGEKMGGIVWMDKLAFYFEATRGKNKHPISNLENRRIIKRESDWNIDEPYVPSMLANGQPMAYHELAMQGMLHGYGMTEAHLTYAHDHGWTTQDLFTLVLDEHRDEYVAFQQKYKKSRELQTLFANGVGLACARIDRKRASH